MHELHDIQRVLFAAPDTSSTPLLSSSSQPRSPVGMLKNRFVNMKQIRTCFRMTARAAKAELDFPELDMQLVNALQLHLWFIGNALAKADAEPLPMLCQCFAFFALWPLRGSALCRQQRPLRHLVAVRVMSIIQTENV